MAAARPRTTGGRKMVRPPLARLYTDGKQYVEFAGNSSDEKPTEGIITGSKFICVDTGIEYLFDEDSNTWYPQEAKE